MADVTIRHYLYGIIIMMFFIGAGMGILSEFQKAAPSFDVENRSGEFNSTFNRLANVESEIAKIQSSFSTKPEWGFFGALNALIQGAWSTLSLIFGSLDFMYEVFEGMEAFFGVPLWIPGIIILFVTVTLAFAIFGLIFQKDA